MTPALRYGLNREVESWSPLSRESLYLWIRLFLIVEVGSEGGVPGPDLACADLAENVMEVPLAIVNMDEIVPEVASSGVRGETAPS